MATRRANARAGSVRSALERAASHERGAPVARANGRGNVDRFALVNGAARRGDYENVNE